MTVVWFTAEAIRWNYTDWPEPTRRSHLGRMFWLFLIYCTAVAVFWQFSYSLCLYLTFFTC